MPVAIAQPPDAKPERISRLIARLEDGDIKVPKFQRGFVWTRDQILTLLDSIYRGYPISSILLWRTEDKLAAERNVGGFLLPATTPSYPTNYILDGQQRVTTIYGALTAAAGDIDSDFRVFFDLRKKSFEYLEAESPEPWKLRLGILFDSSRFRRFQVSLQNSVLEDATELLDESDRVNETFREYSVPVVTVTSATTSEVASIFERINSTGTKLTVFDLMVAGTWTEAFDLNDHADEVLLQLSSRSFDDVDRVTILRILASLSSNSATRESIISLRHLERGELDERMQECKEGLRRAVDFLATELLMSSDDFLPYERQLVLISYVMSQIHPLSIDQVSGLRRLFWRTSFSERYRRGGEGLFDTDLKSAVQALTDHELLDSFGRSVDPLLFSNSEFRRSSALAKAFAILLANNQPRSVLNGASVDAGDALSAFNRKQYHHIFPQKFLRDRGYSPAAINRLANICLLNAHDNRKISDAEPKEYFGMVKSLLAESFAQVMATNFIGEAEMKAIDANDYDAFISARSESLSSAVNRRMAAG